jgi:hypothetical protein
MIEQRDTISRGIPQRKRAICEAAAVSPLVPGDATGSHFEHIELRAEHRTVHSEGMAEDDYRTVAAEVLVRLLLVSSIKRRHAAPNVCDGTSTVAKADKHSRCIRCSIRTPGTQHRHGSFSPYEPTSSAATTKAARQKAL